VTGQEEEGKRSAAKLDVKRINFFGDQLAAD
jgi:hypothetical protein